MTLVLDGTPFANHGTLVVEVETNDLAHDWRNTMELAWDVSGPPAYTDAVITAFVSFIQGSTRDDSHISKVTLFPYVKGRQPLANQGSIWEQNVDLACQDWGTGNVYPAETGSKTAPIGEVCVMLVKGKFAGGGGRVGRIFRRNAIPNEWVKTTAGGPPTFDPVQAPTFVSAWNTFTSTKLSAFCTNNPLPRYVLIHAQKLTQTPAAHDIFDTAMAVPVFERLTMHDLNSKNKR